MKKWELVLISSLAILVLVMAPAAAFAETAGSARPAIKDALAIVVPLTAPAGKEISIGVFARSNQDPVAAAGVWTVTKDNVDTLKAGLQALRQQATPAQPTDYEALLNAKGISLGKTAGNGKLTYAFKDSDRYVIIAVKQNYAPGMASIGIRNVAPALAVASPRIAAPSDKVTITVTNRVTTETVEAANVWALSKDSAQAIRDQVAALRKDTTTPVDQKDYEAVIKGHGTLLGATDKQGKLVASFANEGGYVLVAVKKGFVPGFAAIRIGTVPRPLVLHAPARADVNKAVSLGVTAKNGGGPVAGASIWLLSKEQADSVKAQAAKQKADAAAKSTTPDYEALVRGGGAVLLGKTDDQGKLGYAFTKTGTFVLVATKAGNVPGFAAIRVVETPKPTAVSTTKTPPAATK